MAVGMIAKRMSIRKPYLTAAILEPTSFTSRHDELVEEFAQRGWPSGTSHASPVKVVSPIQRDKNLWDARVHRVFSLLELLRRCPSCRAFYNKIYGEGVAELRLRVRGLIPVSHKWENLMINWTSDTPADATILEFSDTLVREREAFLKKQEV